MVAREKFMNCGQAATGNNVIVRGIMDLPGVNQKTLKGKFFFADKGETGVCALRGSGAVATLIIRNENSLAQTGAGSNNGYRGLRFGRSGKDRLRSLAYGRNTAKGLRHKIVDQDSALEAIIKLGMGDVDFPWYQGRIPPDAFRYRSRNSYADDIGLTWIKLKIAVPQFLQKIDKGFRLSGL